MDLTQHIQNSLARSIKMEVSPTQSFLSLSSEGYPSLFETDDTFGMDMPTTDTPTPCTSYDDEQDDSGLSAIPEDESVTPSDKKPTKKRKSWGQVLPEPKTNLPPRKRAKTDDEKEQRRVERVLRNRRAAQCSRERKRKEVDALEQRNKDLQTQLEEAAMMNARLIEELKLLQGGHGGATRSSASLDALATKLTFSSQLFAANDTNSTVNPASLSPSPKDDLLDDSTAIEQNSSKHSLSPSSDVTQHPAVMLFDPQCHMSDEEDQCLPTLETSATSLMLLPLLMTIHSAFIALSICQRPLIQIAMSLKAGFSLLPNPHLLTTIIWMVTRPKTTSTKPASNSTTSQTYFQRRQTMPRTLTQRSTMTLWTTSQCSTLTPSTLRTKSLRKILSSSPSLARPLRDATMVALRLVLQGPHSQVEDLSVGTTNVPCDVELAMAKSLSSIDLPSKEVLLALLWYLECEEPKGRERNDESVVVGMDSLHTVDGASGDHQSAKNSVAKIRNETRVRRLVDDNEL